jgi:hypothetical protein
LSPATGGAISLHVAAGPALAAAAENLCQARQINIYLALPKGHGLAFDRVAAETMGDGTALPCGLKIVLNAARAQHYASA